MGRNSERVRMLWSCLLVGESVREDMVPFLPCLDLLLLTVSTWSRTRRWPERSVSSVGTASDVSSAPAVLRADLSGSVVVSIFSRPFPCPHCQCSNEFCPWLGSAHVDKKQRTIQHRSAGLTSPEQRERAPPLDRSPLRWNSREFTGRWSVKGGSGHMANGEASQPNAYCSSRFFLIPSAHRGFIKGLEPARRRVHVEVLFDEWTDRHGLFLTATLDNINISCRLKWPNQ